MAMKFFTGHGVNSLANMVAGGYLDGYNPSAGGTMTLLPTGGPFGGAALQFASGGAQGGYVFKNLGANIATLYYGVWLQVNSLFVALYPMAWLDSSNVQVYLKIATSGQITIYNGSNTSLATSVSATLTLGRWTFVELGVVFDPSAGSVELKFNGSDVISLTGSLNTAPSGNSYASVLQYGQVVSSVSFGGGPSAIFADTYVCDASGSHNNTFLGPGQVDTSFPTANDATQFTGTPNTSTSTWENIDSNPSSATSYNFSATATNQDTFTHAAVPGSVSSVLATQLSAFWALDAAGSRTAQLVYKSSSTTVQVPASPLSVSPGYSWGVAIEETDPHTSSPWTVTNLNAAKIGYYLAT